MENDVGGAKGVHMNILNVKRFNEILDKDICLKLSTLAKLSGVRPETFSRWKAGTHPPRLSKLIAVRDVINANLAARGEEEITLDDLLMEV